MHLKCIHKVTYMQWSSYKTSVYILIPFFMFVILRTFRIFSDNRITFLAKKSVFRLFETFFFYSTFEKYISSWSAPAVFKVINRVVPRRNSTISLLFSISFSLFFLTVLPRTAKSIMFLSLLHPCALCLPFRNRDPAIIQLPSQEWSAAPVFNEGFLERIKKKEGIY